MGKHIVVDDDVYHLLLDESTKRKKDKIKWSECTLGYIASSIIIGKIPPLKEDEQ